MKTSDDEGKLNQHELLSNVVEIPSSIFFINSSHLPAQASLAAGESRL
jgi:hypothetical protein